MKNEPRIEISPGKPMMSSDMPTRKVVVQAAPLAPPPTVEPSDLMPMRRRRWFKLPTATKTYMMASLCALLGAVVGVMATMATVQKRVDKANQRDFIAKTLDDLITLGADVSGDHQLPLTAESYAFSRLDLIDVMNAREMRRALRTAAALPGIREISFYDAQNSLTSANPADETVLAVLAQHFPVLDTLNLASSNVHSLQSLEQLKIRHLNIVNTPLSSEKFASIKFIEGLEELSIGWPDRTITKDHPLRSEAVRKIIVELLASHPTLKKVNTYDFTLEKEEREKLSKIEVNSSMLRRTN